MSVILAQPQRQRRAVSVNRRRIACESNENVMLAIRVDEMQLRQLAREFCVWRMQEDVTQGSIYISCRRTKLFLLYLARGGYYHQLRRAEDLSESAPAKYLHDVADFLSSHASQ